MITGLPAQLAAIEKYPQTLSKLFKKRDIARCRALDSARARRTNKRAAFRVFSQSQAGHGAPGGCWRGLARGPVVYNYTSTQGMAYAAWSTRLQRGLDI